MTIRKITENLIWLMQPEDSSHRGRNWREVIFDRRYDRPRFLSLIKFLVWYGVAVVVGIGLSWLH